MEPKQPELKKSKAEAWKEKYGSVEEKKALTSSHQRKKSAIFKSDRTVFAALNGPSIINKKDAQGNRQLAFSSGNWAGTDGLAASSRLLAIPYGKNGTDVAIIPLQPLVKTLNPPEQLLSPAGPPVMKAHSRPVMDMGFSPADPSVFATGSQDGVIKTWRLTTEGLSADQEDPEACFIADEDSDNGKINSLSFHPKVSGVLASSTGTHRLHLWDLNKFRRQVTFTDHIDTIWSMAWSAQGGLLATFARDRVLRLLDPRNPGPSAQCISVTDSAKAGRLLWVDREGETDSSKLALLSFTKESSRQLSFFDIRQFGLPLSVCEVDDKCFGTPLLFQHPKQPIIIVGSKGESTLRFFELSAAGDSANYLNEFKFPDATRGAALAWSTRPDMPPLYRLSHDMHVESYRFSRSSVLRGSVVIRNRESVIENVPGLGRVTSTEWFALQSKSSSQTGLSSASDDLPELPPPPPPSDAAISPAPVDPPPPPPEDSPSPSEPLASGVSLANSLRSLLSHLADENERKHFASTSPMAAAQLKLLMSTAPALSQGAPHPAELQLEMDGATIAALSHRVEELEIRQKQQTQEQQATKAVLQSLETKNKELQQLLWETRHPVGTPGSSTIPSITTSAYAQLHRDGSVMETPSPSCMPLPRDVALQLPFSQLHQLIFMRDRWNPSTP